ncbi:hypothetical protein Q7P37_002458 [Cladosporium fusiforme]
MDEYTATGELAYHDCSGGFQCVRLLLPFDLNATENSPAYAGQTILNFGGPGAPATYFGESLAQGFQTSYDAAYSYGSETHVSDHPDARYFDLIFFHPRGIASTTPWHTCFESPSQLQAFASQVSSLVLDASLESNACSELT